MRCKRGSVEFPSVTRSPQAALERAVHRTQNELAHECRFGRLSVRASATRYDPVPDVDVKLAKRLTAIVREP